MYLRMSLRATELWGAKGSSAAGVQCLQCQRPRKLMQPQGFGGIQGFGIIYTSLNPKPYTCPYSVTPEVCLLLRKRQDLLARCKASQDQPASFRWRLEAFPKKEAGVEKQGTW